MQPKCDIDSQSSNLFYLSNFYKFQKQVLVLEQKTGVILEFHILINLTVYFYNLVGNFDLKINRFVCVEVLPSQPNGVMSSMVSLPNHTFTGQA